MTWVRYDDNVANHPKVAPLDDAPYRLWREAIEWSAHNLTDGVIRAHQLLVTSTRASKARAARHGHEKSLARWCGATTSEKYVMNAPHAPHAPAMESRNDRGVVAGSAVRASIRSMSWRIRRNMGPAWPWAASYRFGTGWSASGALGRRSTMKTHGK